MSRYIYGMWLRGASPGAQSKEGLVEIEKGDDRYRAVITYSRRLTNREQATYDLDYIGEYDEPERVWTI